MTDWGWFNTASNGDGNVTWIKGTLEDSYARVSRYGGQWILASAVPISEYRRVMAETAAAKGSAK